MVKFSECLNDLMDYFILADPGVLTDFKSQYDLPDDLLTEFTTNGSADVAVANGVFIPLAGITNFPYTIYFTLENEPSPFKGNPIQHQKSDYLLQVKSGEIFLFTMPYL
ncbi:MAG: hypothetical protein AAF518_05890, partial [Spirochaetota bacterium]